MSATECPHAERVLLALDCGAGGRQFRRYCQRCWADIEGAIPHSRAQRELRGAPPVLGDLALLHKAQEAFWKHECDQQQVSLL